MKRERRQPCVGIVAGEASGDRLGADLVAALRRRHAGLEFYGIGGAGLRAAGVRLVADAAELSVVGVTEVVAKLPAILKALGAMRRMLRHSPPDLLILIDFPDFNFRVAAEAKRVGVRVLYYVSPQIWAWRSGRVRQLRKLVDHIAVILPFEEAFYRAHGVPVTFVGHPLLEDLPPLRPVAEPQRGTEIVIGLLPGSRSREVARHLPVMLEAAGILQARCKHAKFIVSRAASVADEQFAPLRRGSGPHSGAVSVLEGVEGVLRESHVVVAASGTVTLQAALHAVPMVIIYKVSRLTYWVGRLLIRVRNIGLVNLVAGKNLAPELINDDASPANIARAVAELIADPGAYAALCGELAALRGRLGGPGATGRVAELALGMLAEADRGHR